MKIKIIIKHRKTDRFIFRTLILVVALFLIGSSFAPVRFRYEKVIVEDPPIKWREVIEKNGEVTEVIVRDYLLKISERKRMIVTAYSSTRDQTDSSPFITASNIRVRDGIVACNFLSFGTRVLIPEEFGYSKIFTVEDRMARKHKDRVDIWFPTRKAAKNFGKNKLEIVVLTN